MRPAGSDKQRIRMKFMISLFSCQTKPNQTEFPVHDEGKCGQRQPFDQTSSEYRTNQNPS